MVISGATREGRGTANLKGWVNIAAGGVTDVACCCCLWIKTAIVDDSDSARWKWRRAGEDGIHDMKVMFTLERGDKGIIEFKRAINGLEKGSKRRDPGSF